VNSNTPRSEIIDSENTADNVTAHGIEYQDLPDRIAILIQDRGGVGDEAAMARGIMGVLHRAGIMVQVQEFLNRSLNSQSAKVRRFGGSIEQSPTDLSVSEGHWMRHGRPSTTGLGKTLNDRYLDPQHTREEYEFQQEVNHQSWKSWAF
jgi:hypothetical protein